MSSGACAATPPPCSPGCQSLPEAQYARHQRPRAQLTGAHRLRQDERAQALPEQRGKLRRIGERSGEPQHAAGRRDGPMPQSAFERQHPALARRQELAELLEQRLEHREESRVAFQLIDQLAAAAKARAHLEPILEIARAADEPVECLQLCGAETPREARARQPQRLTDGPYTDARKAVQRVLRPSQCRERQRRKLPDELRRVRDGQQRG